MKYILDHEGKKYRKFFEEIAAIPHESFNEKALSDYIVEFARQRGLWYHQDPIWNVIVKKPASPGYEDHQPVMIQGHIDMVCVKTPESAHNFEKDPLRLYVEDGFLRAQGTTLGADCGHGISYMLSILDDQTLKHPPLECLFTVQEEVGIGGPKQLDYSLLSARRLIFTDSMEEGAPELSTTSVLGGNYIRPVQRQGIGEREASEGFFFQVTAGGLTGGHAAVDINKGRGNAIKILSRAAYNLLKLADLRLCSFEGGTLKNNIPEKGKMVFYTNERAQFSEIIKGINETIQMEYRRTDPGLLIEFCETKREPSALTSGETRTVIEWLMEIPTGTFATSPEDPSFPLTSRNLGTVRLTDDELVIGYMYRSAVSSHIGMLFDEQEILSRIFGGKWEKEYEYPGCERGRNTDVSGV